MPITNKPTRVISIGDPGPTQDQIFTALSSQSNLVLVETFRSVENITRAVRQAEPDIILIDSTLGGKPTIGLIDDLSLQFPDAAVVTILPSEEPALAQQATLAGARAFVLRPFTQINLINTLNRVRDLEDRRRQSVPAKTESGPESHPLHAMGVFSPRGGVGCSTVATNMAIAMSQMTDKRILLLEGKMFFGHLDVFLNLRAHNTIADLIPHANHLDENLVQDVVVKHASGLHVLLAPSNIQVAQGIRPDDLYKVLTSVMRMYDLMVIDLGSSLNENTVTFMDAVDKIMLVASPDLASLHDISRFIQITRSLDYTADKLLFVLNRVGMPGGVKAHDIETALHTELFAQIPYDEGIATRSLNRGIPLITRYPRNHVSIAIRDLANSVIQMAAESARMNVPLPSAEPVSGGVLASARS